MRKTSEVYENLYHYTNWEGLYGILRNKTLWATHCKFLNDYSEISLFKSKLMELLRPHLQQKIHELSEELPNVKNVLNGRGGLNAVVEHETSVFVDSMYNVTGNEFYITSFCGEHKDKYVNENGLLSQWRGYGKDGGFALVFNTQKLEEILQLEADRFYMGLMLADVIYSDDEEKFKSELSGQIEDVAEYVKKMLYNMVLGKDELVDAIKAFPAFVRCIASYKHCGFKEENEVRIAALINDAVFKDAEQGKQDKERKVRVRQPIPYIELFKDMVLPSIERIIVGPHKEKEDRASALRLMLRNTGIDVDVSNIPYIS